MKRRTELAGVKMRAGLVIDLKKCIGCGACAAICRQTKATPAGVHYSRVLKYETGRFPRSRLHTLPVLCMHCSAAPCLRVCPTGATYRKDDGTILINSEVCIGCRACMQACPYEARQFLWAFRNHWPDRQPTPFDEHARKNFDVGTVIKCDFCQSRQREGREPGCVEACPTGARVFGDLDDPASEVSRLIRQGEAEQLRAELGTDPSVWYLHLPG